MCVCVCVCVRVSVSLRACVCVCCGRTELSSESEVCDVMTGLKLLGDSGLSFFLMARICSSARNAEHANTTTGQTHRETLPRVGNTPLYCVVLMTTWNVILVLFTAAIRI